MVLIESRKGKFEFKNAWKIRGTRIYFPRALNLAAIFGAGIRVFDRRAADVPQLKIAAYVLCNLDVHYVAR
jgi:hypothetical protein